jgi:hypothetical protein
MAAYNRAVDKRLALVHYAAEPRDTRRKTNALSSGWVKRCTAVATAFRKQYCSKGAGDLQTLHWSSRSRPAVIQFLRRASLCQCGRPIRCNRPATPQSNAAICSIRRAHSSHRFSTSHLTEPGTSWHQLVTMERPAPIRGTWVMLRIGKKSSTEPQAKGAGL